MSDFSNAVVYDVVAQFFGPDVPSLIEREELLKGLLLGLLLSRLFTLLAGLVLGDQKFKALPSQERIRAQLY